ncbi:MAG: DUF1289 domain-containing protein, partial [Pseudomonadota bacterium]
AQRSDLPSTGSPMSHVSPCVGLCRLDEATGYCLGCARTGDEIADWGNASLAVRESVWSILPERFEALEVTCRRMPWDTEQIRSFVQESLRKNAGTWVMGVVGAVGEFTAAQGEAVEVWTENDDIFAATTNARLRFQIDDDVRALTFEPKDTPIGQSRIVLAVKRERGRPPVANVISDLGDDRAALTGGERGHLFDLGLGRKEARFCVRVAEGAARDALDRTQGEPLLQSLGRIGADLITESPTRVIETALGRMEVEGPIPPPGGQSPDGPHTHLLPDHLATGRAMPAGMDLPRAYLPGAIFYPRP